MLLVVGKGLIFYVQKHFRMIDLQNNMQYDYNCMQLGISFPSCMDDKYD